MLDIKFIRQNADLVKQAVQEKCLEVDIDTLLALDRDIQGLKTQLQDLQAQRNENAKKIPQVAAHEREALITHGRQVGADIDLIKPQLKEKEEAFMRLMYQVPNIPAIDAPRGMSDADNVEVRQVGSLPTFTFPALSHIELLEKNRWAEFEGIAHTCGSRSYALKGHLVLLEMALLHFTLDRLLQKGFNLISTPSFAREAALYGTGHLPAGRDQIYYLPEDELFLSGTVEVQINSLHAQKILNEQDLPLLYAGLSPCFRREAGHYGRDVRGLIRVHQFVKVEQYIFCRNDAEESLRWHQVLLQTAEEILQALELPYRVVACCTGDMGPGKIRQNDIETWVPSEQRYRETHSCSTLHEWQARRTQTRYRDKDGEVLYCHTLNNTALASPRILVPFLENHQTEAGGVRIPAALQPYLHGKTELQTG